jgi:hypothetical protein
LAAQAADLVRYGIPGVRYKIDGRQEWQIPDTDTDTKSVAVR